jgi:pimeloyl-ACP methyl ester carboxylesterase
MSWLTVGGSDIHYLEVGSGQPLLFLHGNGSSALNWHQQVDAFRNNYRVIAYDSVNHGHSSNSPANEPEPDRVDELEGVLAALGIDRPILCGHSMGGSTVVRWACRHPDQAMALIVSGMGVPREGTGAPRAASPLPVEAAFLPPSEGTFTDDWVRDHALELERYARLRSTGTRLEAQRHPRQATAANPSRNPQELSSLARGIRSPMLVIVGARDNLRPAAEHLHELVSHSRLHVVEGNAHNEYYQAADEFNRVVGQFLAVGD